MKKIVITGAGSAQSNATINCLLKENTEDLIIGPGSDQYDLMFCRAHVKYLIPHASKENHKKCLLKLLEIERPDMIHFQHDLEVWKSLQFKKEIENLGVNMHVPSLNVVDKCVHKFKTWQCFKSVGLKVPENLEINSSKDLKLALKELGDSKGEIWIRSKSIGNGGKGSLRVSDYNEAYNWIQRCNGWGLFIAAEPLTTKSVTWLSIWDNGKLIVGQGRSRHSWAYSSMAPSGVTGITKVCETISDKLVDDIALKAIYSVADKPHGIFGVDMTYDKNGIPNPTEINISRFFTTIEFFAEAGLNMPAILRNLVIDKKYPSSEPIINPLQSGLLWIRTLDERPILTTKEEINLSLKKVSF